MGTVELLRNIAADVRPTHPENAGALLAVAEDFEKNPPSLSSARKDLADALGSRPGDVLPSWSELISLVAAMVVKPGPLSDLSSWPEFAVTKHTSDHRGDHAADVVVAVAARGHEKVGALLNRVSLRPTDHLEIRRVTTNGETK